MRRGAAAGWPGPPRKAGRRGGRPGRCGGGLPHADRESPRRSAHRQGVYRKGPMRRRRRAKERREGRSHKPTRRCATASRETRKECRPRSGAGAARSTRRPSTTRAGHSGSAHDHSAHKVRRGDGPARRPRQGAPRRRQAACKGTRNRSMCGHAAAHRGNRTVGEGIARMHADALPPGIKAFRSNAIDSVVSIRDAARPIMETILGCQGPAACGDRTAFLRCTSGRRTSRPKSPPRRNRLARPRLHPLCRAECRLACGRSFGPVMAGLGGPGRRCRLGPGGLRLPRPRRRWRPAGAAGLGPPASAPANLAAASPAAASGLEEGPAPARPPVRSLPPPCSATERRSPVPAAAAAADGAAAPACGSPPRSCTARGRIRRGSPPAAL